MTLYGIEKAVVYYNDSYFVWDGIVSYDKPSDSNTTPVYFDGQKVAQDHTRDSGVVMFESFTRPDFSQFVSFDVVFVEYQNGEEIVHILYGLSLESVNAVYKTTSTNLLVETFKHTLLTKSKKFPGGMFGPELVIRMNDISESAARAIKDQLFGTDLNQPKVPEPYELVRIIESTLDFEIIDHGDGTWSAISRIDGVLSQPDETSFEIKAPTAVYLSADTYQISSF